MKEAVMCDMENTFESRFSELQADMVSICLEYCENKSETIFIHVICGIENVYANFFFKMDDGKLYKKSNLGSLVSNASLQRQKATLSIIMQNTRDLIRLCESNNRPMPSEIKLIYNVPFGQLEAEYNYDSLNRETTASEVSEEWFNALKK
jgi:hypothetical protein